LTLPSINAAVRHLVGVAISKRDLKMMTDNELFNGMTLVRDDGDGLNEMVDELSRRARDLSVSDYLQKSVRQGTLCAGGRSDHQPSLTAGLLASLRAAERRRVSILRRVIDSEATSMPACGVIATVCQAPWHDEGSPRMLHQSGSP
jgi:hypothetical protein